MNFLLVVEQDLVCQLARKYPNLMKGGRVNRLASILNQKTHIIKREGGEQTISGFEIMEYMVRVLCNGLQHQIKEINKTLDRGDFHIFNRKTHQAARDQVRLQILSKATLAILNKNTNYNVSPSSGAIGSSSAYHSVADGNTNYYQTEEFTKIANKAWEHLYPSDKALLDHKRKMTIVRKQAIKEYERRQAKAGAAAAEYKKNKRRMHRIMVNDIDYRKQAQNDRADLFNKIRQNNIGTFAARMSTLTVIVQNKLTTSFQKQRAQFDTVMDDTDTAYNRFKVATEKVQKSREKHEAFKAGLARGLGQALKLAPPPIGAIGSIITGAASLALSGMEDGYKAISSYLATTATAYGVDGVQERTDEMYGQFKTEASKRAKIWETSPPPDAASVLKSDSLRGMADKFQKAAMDQAIEIVGEVTSGDHFVTSNSLATALQRNRQVADDLLDKVMPEASFQELRKTGDAKTAVEFTGIFIGRIEQEENKFCNKVDGAGIGWFEPNGKTGPFLQDYIELWLWALYFNHFHMQEAGSWSLPNIWPAAVERLEALRFISRSSPTTIRAGSGRTKIHYRKSHASDRFFVYYVLSNWANSGPNPLELLFDRQVSRAKMDELIQIELTRFFMEAQYERRMVHEETMLSSKTTRGWTYKKHMKRDI